MLLGATVLTLATHAQQTVGPGLTSFADQLGEHVFYIGTNGTLSDVYEQTLSPGNFYWSSSLDIIPSAASSSALTGFADSSGEHVFFEDTNKNIHHLFLSFASGSTWTDTNLSALYSSTHAVAGSALAGFSDSSGIHVFYIGVYQSTQHVYRFYLPSGGTWNNKDLSIAGGAAAPGSGSGLAAFVDGSGEHVFYRGIEGTTTDPDVYQLYLSTGTTKWNSINVSAEAGPTTVDALGKGLAAFSDSSGIHVFYTDANSHGSHVSRLYLSSASGSQWNWKDLTPAGSGISLPYPGSALAAYPDTSGGEHVFYICAELGPEICALTYANGSGWSFTDLYALFLDGAQVDPASALSGFEDTNGDHGFYVNPSQNPYQVYYSFAYGWQIQRIPTTTNP